MAESGEGSLSHLVLDVNRVAALFGKSLMLDVGQQVVTRRLLCL